MKQEFGFDPDKVQIEPEAYLLGALAFENINDGGQWETPLYEPQAENYETWGCTIWGGQNQIEIYFKKVFGFEPNYNEIFNYIKAGVGVGGGDPQKAYESFRHDGLVNHDLISFPATYEEFINPKQITPAIESTGKKWLVDYELWHEWLVKPTKEEIKFMLKSSPIAIGVTAWFEENGLYVDRGMKNTHWCVAYGYIEDARGIILKVFDSYDHSEKLLHPAHSISLAKRILIKRKPKGAEIKLTFWRRFWQGIKWYFAEILK